MLIYSPWKINTLSFHYRQAIRHRTIEMKSKSNLERKLLIILPQEVSLPLCSAPAWPALGQCIWRVQRWAWKNVQRLLSIWYSGIFCVSSQLTVGSHLAVHRRVLFPFPSPLGRQMKRLSSFLVQKQTTENSGRGRLCAPPCEIRTQPRHSPGIKSQRVLTGSPGSPVASGPKRVS